MAKIIGTEPNQVPLNQHLGSLAYQNKDAVRVNRLTISSDPAQTGTTAVGTILIARNESANTSYAAIQVNGSPTSVSNHAIEMRSYAWGTAASDASTGSYAGAGQIIVAHDYPATKNLFISSQSGAVIFQAGSLSGERMRINSDGNVGVGTITPQLKFEVNNSVTGSNSFQAHLGATISSGYWTGFQFGYVEAGNQNYRKSGIIFERQDSSARGKIHILNNGDANATSCTLSDARLTLLYDGKVGIGYTNPGYLLDVAGDARIATGFIQGGLRNSIQASNTYSRDQGVIWVKMATVQSPVSCRIKYYAGTGNSEERGEIHFQGTYVQTYAKLKLSRQTYNGHVRRVVATCSAGGQPYGLWAEVDTGTSSVFASGIVFAYQVIEADNTINSIDNTTGTPTNIVTTAYAGGSGGVVYNDSWSHGLWLDTGATGYGMRIGTTDSGGYLVLKTTDNSHTGGIRFYDAAGSDRANMYYNGNQQWIIHGGSAPGGGDVPTLQFATNGSSRTPRMSITRDGKVGVGKTNPTYLLEIDGGNSSDSATAISHNGHIKMSAYFYKTGSTQLIVRCWFANYSSGLVTMNYAHTNGGDYGAHALIFVNNSYGSLYRNDVFTKLSTDMGAISVSVNSPGSGGNGYLQFTLPAGNGSPGNGSVTIEGFGPFWFTTA